MTPLTRASVGLEPTRSGRCPAHTAGLSATLPARPWPSRAVGWRVPRHRTGLPVLRPFPSSMRAAATYPGGTCRCMCRSLPDRWQPSPISRRVGFRIARFGACSAFTGVAARMVAKPPLAARCIGVLQTMSLPPSSAPTATGWNDSCRAGFAPAEEGRLPRRTRNDTLSARGPLFTPQNPAFGSTTNTSLS